MFMDDICHKLQTKPTRFLDQLRLHIRQQGLAYKTEQTYVYWVKRFIYFHNKQQPKNLGAALWVRLLDAQHGVYAAVYQFGGGARVWLVAATADASRLC